MDPYIAAKIIAAGIEKVKIRSVFTCNCIVGVCAKCYGANMATAKQIELVKLLVL